jgi:hypothetical protein
MNGKTARKIRKLARALVESGVAPRDKYVLLYRRLKRAWHTQPELFKGPSIDSSQNKISKEG